MRSYIFRLKYGERDPVSEQHSILQVTPYGIELTEEEFAALTADELRQLIRSYDVWGRMRVISHADGNLKIYNDRDLYRVSKTDDQFSWTAGYETSHAIKAESPELGLKLAIHWAGYHERIHGVTMVVSGNRVRLDFGWLGRRSNKAKRLLHAAGFSSDNPSQGTWVRDRSDEAVAAARQVLEDIHALRGS
jgi:hypothetical protein